MWRTMILSLSKMLTNTLWISKAVFIPIISGITTIILPLILNFAPVLFLFMAAARLLGMLGLENQGFRLSYAAVRLFKAIINGAMTAAMAGNLEFEREKVRVKAEQERKDKELEKELVGEAIAETPEGKKFYRAVTEEAASKSGIPGAVTFTKFMNYISGK